MSDSIDQQVCQIAADVFGVPLAKINRESSPQTLENWDSVQHLNFILRWSKGSICNLSLRISSKCKMWGQRLIWLSRS